MKRVAAVLVGALLLAGCTAAASPNSKACEDFAAATVPLLNSMAGSGDDWAVELDKIDSIALTAEGDVKDRMLAFVTDAPSEGEIFVNKEARDKVNEMIASVARACEAAGTPIEVNSFTS